jgi:hypothetical protein
MKPIRINVKHRASYFLSLNSRILVFIFCILISQRYSAQTAKESNDIRVTKGSGQKKIDIEFDNTKEIYNLLVLITDSTGRTIFLDNRYRFKGNYRHTVDMTGEKSGNYKLNVTLDETRINKNLRVD